MMSTTVFTLDELEQDGRLFEQPSVDAVMTRALSIMVDRFSMLDGSRTGIMGGVYEPTKTHCFRRKVLA